MILVLVVTAAAGAFSVTRATTKQYDSSARLFVDIHAAAGVQEALQGVQLSGNLLQSYVEIVESRSTAERILERLDLPETAADLQERLRAELVPNTLLVSVTARAPDPLRARLLADTAAEVFREVIEDLERDKETPVVARIVDSATTPESPVTPQPVRNLGAGVALGLLLGAVVVLLLEALDRSVRSSEETARLLGVPNLAVVPHRRNANVLRTESTGDPGAEAYRTLRTSVRFVQLDQPLRSMLFTSASVREGKTTTVANVAAALAQGGQRVVAVDGDLRRPALGKLFGVDQSVGVTSVTTGQSELDDSLRWVSEFLAVLPAGPIAPNPSEIASSAALADLLTELEGRFDVVVVDAPPVLPVTDAVAMSTQVDGVVLVVRGGRTNVTSAAEARGRLDTVGANLLGFVLNDVRRARLSYGRTYSHPYTARRTTT